jgi:DegV family protein with EDD domain
MSKKNSVALLADSTATLPAELTKQYPVEIVLQHIIWGTEDLLDLQDLTAKAFYARLSTDPIHPKTSQPPAKEFLDHLEQVKKEGAQEAVVLTVSSTLSGTYQSAMQAAKMTDFPVHVHDSRSVGMGLGWQVIAAARVREAGGDAKAMIAAAESVRQRICMMLTVDTLDYLHKGGRIGTAAKWAGSLLDLKPQLIVNPESGLVERGSASRTRKKATEATYNAFFEKIQSGKKVHVVVHHAAALLEAETWVTQIRGEYPTAEVYLNELSPVLGVHGGPGTLALCGYSEG